jgi:hypothetical protein
MARQEGQFSWSLWLILNNESLCRVSAHFLGFSRPPNGSRGRDAKVFIYRAGVEAVGTRIFANRNQGVMPNR